MHAKVGFALKSVVLVVKSKPKLSDFSGELKDKCVEFLFFTADVISVTDSIICGEVAWNLGCTVSPSSQQIKLWLVEKVQ